MLSVRKEYLEANYVKLLKESDPGGFDGTKRGVLLSWKLCFIGSYLNKD